MVEKYLCVLSCRHFVSARSPCVHQTDATHPCATHALPLATNTPADIFVLLSSTWSNVGDRAANASTFSTAIPSAMKPRPVRVQARKVRSEARRSRARELWDAELDRTQI